MSLDTVEKIVTALIKISFVVLVMGIFWGGVLLEVHQAPEEEQQAFLKEQRELYMAVTQDVKVNSNLPDPWPPQVNARYPDFALIDQNGTQFNLSDLEGRVVVLEYIDMSSLVSQKQSGSDKVGTFGQVNNPTKKDITSYVFSDILTQDTNGGTRLPHPKLVELKVIIYGEGGEQASRDDAERWANHFGLTNAKNEVVAVPVKDLRDPLTDQSIGGYQLLDTKLRLRADSSGTEVGVVKHNLRLTLLPLVPNLLR